MYEAFEECSTDANEGEDDGCDQWPKKRLCKDNGCLWNFKENYCYATANPTVTDAPAGTDANEGEDDGCDQWPKKRLCKNNGCLWNVKKNYCYTGA